MRQAVILLLSLVIAVGLHGQEKGSGQFIAAGVEFRPIFPAAFLKTGDQLTENDEYSVLVSPRFGFSAGMVVRYGFHSRFALETGLNFVQRNYDLSIARDSTALSPPYESNTDFTIVGYEHPIKFLVFVRLAEKLYMNAAAGFQLTFFPSDIFTSDKDISPNDQHFRHSSLRLGFDGQTGADGFIHGGAMANLGWEYRTGKAGTLYLGATYHIPFADIYRSKFQYVEDSYESDVQAIGLNGSYLTFDIRYFFPSKPIMAREHRKKRGAKGSNAPAE